MAGKEALARLTAWLLMVWLYTWSAPDRSSGWDPDGPCGGIHGHPQSKYATRIAPTSQVNGVARIRNNRDAWGGHH